MGLQILSSKRGRRSLRDRNSSSSGEPEVRSFHDFSSPRALSEAVEHVSTPDSGFTTPKPSMYGKY